MKRFFRKPFCWAIVFSVILTGFTGYVLLDTFVIPKSYAKVVANTTTEIKTNSSNGVFPDSAENSLVDTSELSVEEDMAQAQSDAVITDTSYTDDNIKINISTTREYDTDIYIADIQVSDISFLKTALASDTYGRNIKAATSEIAKYNKAIFAVNGDFYGFRDYGYVLRDGIFYRDIAGDAEDLVIDNSGNFSIINEATTDAYSLELESIWQILSFGPAILQSGSIMVDSSSEVSRSMPSNPRTAIGMIAPLHYIIIVSDGRTNKSTGLSLLELAIIFDGLGCTTAYNLDGGGSSTMYFNGGIVNIPTDGRTFGEREVSDIVYIGY